MIMIEDLSYWVKNIIYIIFFIVFLEILLPNNSMRKYVKVVGGLLVMVVILSPLTKFINKEINLSDVIAKNIIDIEQVDLKSKNTLLQEKQDYLTTKIYKERVISNIKERVEDIVGEADVEVEVEINEDSVSNEYGSIKKVFLYFRQRPMEDIGEFEEEGIVKNIGPIKKVEIDKESQEDNKKEDILMIRDIQEREIKEFLLDFYNVPSENISINEQMNNREKGEVSVNG
ncbi:MAG TPA: stage III sporulation protein AF [Eubacteriaceae bacterium]|nr:stage III sporulation protein AF [Eubacteriaceae bacterium]